MPRLKEFKSYNGQKFTGTQAQYERRNTMPYGRWTCADGRVVLFNRFYEPIFERSPGERLSYANPAERVAFIREEWFYKDGDPEKEKRRKALDGVRELQGRVMVKPETV